MVRFSRYLFIIIPLCLGACVPGGPSDLKKSLAVAVKEKRVSREKMDAILREYEMLLEKNQESARKYVLQIVSAIEMGADSSHIDVVRRQIGAEAEKSDLKGA